MEDPLADPAPSTIEVAQDLSHDGVEPTDFEEFADWKPVVGVAVIFAFILTIFTIGILRTIGAPHWFDTVVGALYLSSPVIDRDVAETTLAAMLDAVANAPDLPKIIALDALSAEPAARDALMRVTATRGFAVHTFSTGERPMLASGLDTKSYFEAALSASSRKKLRQYRRRLGEKGRLETRHLTAPESV